MLSRAYFKSFCAYVHVAKGNLLRKKLDFCVCGIRSRKFQELSRIQMHTYFVTLDNETAEKRVINTEVRIN